MSVQVNGYLFDTLGYIQYYILYFAVEIVPALAIGRSFSQLLCSLDTASPLWVFFSISNALLSLTIRSVGLVLYISYLNQPFLQGNPVPFIMIK